MPEKEEPFVPDYKKKRIINKKVDGFETQTFGKMYKDYQKHQKEKEQ